LKWEGKDAFPIAYGEAKDMHISLEKIEKSEQLARYFGYAKLILTNGIEFRFYKNGIRYGEPILLATKNGASLTFHEENFGIFRDRLLDFFASPTDDIRRAGHLAEIMWGKARRIRDDLRIMLQSSDKYADIWKLYHTFKEEILHDLSTHDFADLYAQTLVYGLFVARYHDPTPETFSRGEARDLVPKSNPLLRTFFDHIAGNWYEKRLEYIVDELCEVFAHANVEWLMHGLYQKETHDPVIHFYEDFLSEYDSDLRMARGVFYTPAPVVKFIIRAVDDVLIDHFNLPKWLADTSKIKVEREIQKYDKKWERKTEIIETHRVQILDPATGTGTFLDEIVRHIHSKMSGQAGMWPSYVNQDLLPRLHGFELMMASYTIAHLKLGLTLAETGVPNLEKRLQIYLTNSLEEAKWSKENQWNIFGLLESITDEARQADEVKRDNPVMIVVGNPPYSGISTNVGKWITEKIEDYKYIDGVHFGEKKHWLQDDYVKFFRLGESLIEKNGEWILAYITNHGYLDNPTFRGMRWHLLQTFDYIYIVDLHGNSKKKETAPDGSKDENVFDIQQGTAIFVGVKNKEKKEWEPGRVTHIDQYGKRQSKYDWLETNSLVLATELIPADPYYFFVPKNTDGQGEYEAGFSVGEIFPVNWSWIVTARDEFVISYDKKSLSEKMQDFINLSVSEARIKYNLREDVESWKVEWAQKEVKETINSENSIISIAYRPFDLRYIYYTKKSSWIIARPNWGIMTHLMTKENIALDICRQWATDEWTLISIIKTVVDNSYVSNRTKERGYTFPLYLYSNSENLEWTTKTPNLDATIWAKISESVGRDTTPEEVLDYIYAVLHSPSYREKYKEFLKIDFPRVPYPTSRKQFESLVTLGGELRALHLLESPVVENYITTFPVAGTNEVEKVTYTDGCVYINAEQYFGDVPEVAWNFYIWWYQPAQKWLKDRKCRTLTWEDIAHYQSMIVALTETSRVMGEVDGVLESNGK
jgi:predicted helicase